jgi:aminopeptidase
MDGRKTHLLQLIVEHSCAIKKGERVLIESINVPIKIITELMREVRRKGGKPIVVLKDDQILREICNTYDDDEWDIIAQSDLDLMKKADVFIGMRSPYNLMEFSDVQFDKRTKLISRYINPLHNEYRNQNMRWIAVRWPNPSMAQRATMSTEAFEEFYFSACLLNYERMDKAMDPLVELMEKTENVHIVGPEETDLSFEINGMNIIKCAGKVNIPDGEVYTAPIKNSVRGRIGYNVPSVYHGETFDHIILDFEDGKVVNIESDNDEGLSWILDQDEGARYVGEFAFGLNPNIVAPMRDILFDEKIAGSIHLAQGNAYPECNNGNRSAIHWDLILKQTSDVGGGDIYFDGEPIRKNGLFVRKDLMGLNPDNLI